MNRHMVYPGQVPLETDVLNVALDGYLGMGRLAAAVLGSAPVAVGFAVTPTSPPSMTVAVAPGQVYVQAALDEADFSSLGTNALQVTKQGVMATPFMPAASQFTAPANPGESINYLIQVGFQSVDQGAVVLPYFNSATVGTAWSGPGGNGNAQATVRADLAVISVVAGTAAATGSQQTPSPSAGQLGLYVVTLNHGDSFIGSAAISLYSRESFLGHSPEGFSLNGLASLDSPAFTGSPSAPTPPAGDASTKIATTAFVSGMLGGASAVTGEIKLWPVATLPPGYLECDGSAVSRATHVALFAVLGVAYGVGDGTTTFNLPDLRGEFVRGWDHGRNLDAGRALGSGQQDAVQEITGAANTVATVSGHSYPVTTGALTASGGNGLGAAAGGDWYIEAGNVIFDAAGSARTAAETRPRNVALMYIIKT